MTTTSYLYPQNLCHASDVMMSSCCLSSPEQQTTVAWACTSASNLQQRVCFVRTRCNKTINIWDQCSETSPVKWITGWSLQYYRLVHLWTGLDHTHSPLLLLPLLEFHFGEESDANLASESEKDNACAAKKFPCFQCIMNGWLCWMCSFRCLRMLQ